MIMDEREIVFKGEYKVGKKCWRWDTFNLGWIEVEDRMVKRDLKKDIRLN